MFRNLGKKTWKGGSKKKPRERQWFPSLFFFEADCHIDEGGARVDLIFCTRACWRDPYDSGGSPYDSEGSPYDSEGSPYDSRGSAYDSRGSPYDLGGVPV